MLRFKIYLMFQLFIGFLVILMQVISHLTFGLLFFSIRIVGGDNLKGLCGPMVIIGNHKHYIDPLIMTIPFIRYNMKILPVRVLGADHLFEINILGWCIHKLLGVIPSNRGNGPEVYMQKPMKYLSYGGSIGIFPEGGLRFDEGVHEFKKGAARIAKAAGVQVLPVAIIGLEDCSFRDLFIGRRTIQIVIGEPTILEQKENEDVATTRLHSMVSALYYENKLLAA